MRCLECERDVAARAFQSESGHFLYQSVNGYFIPGYHLAQNSGVAWIICEGGGNGHHPPSTANDGTGGAGGPCTIGGRDTVGPAFPGPLGGVICTVLGSSGCGGGGRSGS